MPCKILQTQMSSLSVTTQTSVYLFHQIAEIHVENNQILICKMYHQLLMKMFNVTY